MLLAIDASRDRIAFFVFVEAPREAAIELEASRGLHKNNRPWTEELSPQRSGQRFPRFVSGISGLLFAACGEANGSGRSRSNDPERMDDHCRPVRTCWIGVANHEVERLLSNLGNGTAAELRGLELHALY